MEQKFKTEAEAKAALQHKCFEGPFSKFDTWALVNHKFLTDTLLYRLCLHANSMISKREEEEGIGTRMWVEHPIAFAKCVQLKDLTVVKEMVSRRMELVKQEEFPTWHDMLLQGKVIFVPINFPLGNHWIAGLVEAFTNHSQGIHESSTRHSRIIHRCHFVRQEGSSHYPTLRQFL